MRAMGTAAHQHESTEPVRTACQDLPDAPAIDPPTKTKLAAWHRSITTEPGLYADWEEIFRTDEFGHRASLTSLLSSLTESLEASSA